MAQNPHQRCGTTRRSRRASEEPESVGGAGGAGEHGRVLKTRARPRRPRAVGVAQANFARNFPRSFFETTQKRCNSNDTNSRFELLAGELRAKLLIDSHNWATCNKTQEGAAHRHTQRTGHKAGPAAHRHTQQPGPKAGPDGAPQDRHTSGATAGKATTSSPSGPCARGDASRPCRSGCEPRCAAPRLRYR